MRRDLLTYILSLDTSPSAHLVVVSLIIMLLIMHIGLQTLTRKGIHVLLHNTVGSFE